MTTIIVLLFLANLILGVKLFFAEKQIQKVSSILHNLIRDIAADFDQTAKSVNSQLILIEYMCGFLVPMGFSAPTIAEVERELEMLLKEKESPDK